MSHCKHLINSINDSIYNSIVTYYVIGAIFNLHGCSIQWVLILPLLSLLKLRQLSNSPKSTQ